jgi:hypothetical protein
MFGGKKRNTRINNLIRKNKAGREKRTSIEKLLLGVAIISGIITLGIMIYTFIPSARVIKQLNLSEMIFHDAGITGITPEKPVYVEVEYPTKVFAGDVDQIRMTFYPSGIKTSDPSNLVAEFLLEVDGSNIGPDGDILIPLVNPYPAAARWKFSPYQGGELSGKIWLHLQVNNQQGEIKNILLIAYPIELHADVLLGGSVMMVRLVCIFVGFASLLFIVITIIKNRVKNQNTD